jgi:hypothetical protein
MGHGKTICGIGLLDGFQAVQRSELRVFGTTDQFGARGITFSLTADYIDMGIILN